MNKLKRIKQLENHLRSNGDADFEEEYIKLHKELGIQLPNDFQITSTMDCESK